MFEGVPLLEHQDEEKQEKPQNSKSSICNFSKNEKQEEIWKGENAVKKETVAKAGIMCLAIFIWVGLWVFVFDPFGGGGGEVVEWQSMIYDDHHEEERVPSDDRYAEFEEYVPQQQIMATTNEESVPPLRFEEVVRHNSFHTSEDVPKAGIAHQHSNVASAGDTSRDPSNAWDLQIEYAVRAKRVEKLVDAGENVMIAFTSSQQLPNCASFRPVWHDFAHRAHHQSTHLNNLVVAEIDCAVTQCSDSALELPYYAWYHRGQQLGPSVRFGPQTTVQGLLDTSIMMIAMEKEHIEVETRSIESTEVMAKLGHDHFASNDGNDGNDGNVESASRADDEQQTKELVDDATLIAIQHLDEAEEEEISANKVMLMHHLQKAKLSATLEIGKMFANDGQIVDVEAMAQEVSQRLEEELHEEFRERADALDDKKAEEIENFAEALEDVGRAETIPRNLPSKVQLVVSELKDEIDEAAIDMRETLEKKMMSITMEVANDHLRGKGEVAEIGEDGKLRKHKEGTKMQDDFQMWHEGKEE